MAERKIVDYVAGLARINVSPEEKEFLNKQLSKILEYIDKLNELNVEEVEPMRGLHPENNIFRSDEVKPSSCQDDILNNAPAKEDNYFKIPKVIE